METEIQNFNKAATDLQQTEFRAPKTPAEWQRMHKDPPKRDYSKLFSAVSPLIDAFVSANPAERSTVALRLNDDALGILRTFAHSASIVAVRRESPPLIAQGLAALAILGEVDDPKDLIFYVAVLHYSALRLGLDALGLFSEAASLSSQSFFRDQLRGFPLRPPRSRDLAAFKLRATNTLEGFDIVQDL